MIPTIVDGHQPNGRGLYTNSMDSYTKGGMAICVSVVFMFFLFKKKMPM